MSDLATRLPTWHDGDTQRIDTAELEAIPTAAPAAPEMVGWLTTLLEDAREQQRTLGPQIDAHDTRLRALAEEEAALQTRLEEIRTEARALGEPHQARMQQFAELDEAIGHLDAARHLLTR